MKFSEILKCQDYESVLLKVIEKEIIDLFYNSMKEIIEYFESKLHLEWPSNEKDSFIEASLIRNCIIHNMALVDPKLSKYPQWNLGEEIKLTASDVHSIGISARTVIRSLYQQAEERHFNKK